MSVLNPKVERFDLHSRTAWLFGSVTEFHPIDDVYEEYVHARKNNDFFLQQGFTFFETKGGENKTPDGSKRVDRRLECQRGAKIVLQDGSDEVENLGEILSDDGSDPIDRSQITGKKVFIPYVPKTEIITITKVITLEEAEPIVSEALKQVLCGNG